MKSFVKRLLLFMIPLIVVGALCEYKIRTVGSYYKQKMNGLVKQADSIEVLVLGSSHAAEGIDPGQFDFNAYNMAFGSQTLFYDERITVDHLDEFNHLKYVLISVDYHSLYYPHNDSRDLFYHYYYDIDYHDDKHYILVDISYFFFGFKPEMSMELLSNKMEQLDDGWFSYDTTYYSSFSDEATAKRVDYFNAIIQNNIIEKEKILASLDRFIETLIDEGIMPVIISSPLHKNYLNKLDSSIKEQNEIDILYLCEKYDLEYNTKHKTTKNDMK